MNVQKALKALTTARGASKTSTVNAAKSQAAAEAAHEAHRAAKLVYKAAKKGARAARETWHQARDRARRDASKAAGIIRQISKLEKKAAGSNPKSKDASKPAKTGNAAKKKEKGTSTT